MRTRNNFIKFWRPFRQTLCSVYDISLRASEFTASLNTVRQSGYDGPFSTTDATKSISAKMKNSTRFSELLLQGDSKLLSRFPWPIIISQKVENSYVYFKFINHPYIRRHMVWLLTASSCEEEEEEEETRKCEPADVDMFFVSTLKINIYLEAEIEILFHGRGVQLTLPL